MEATKKPRWRALAFLNPNATQVLAVKHKHVEGAQLGPA
jgi:hypothetical protein